MIKLKRETVSVVVELLEIQKVVFPIPSIICVSKELAGNPVVQPLVPDEFVQVSLISFKL